MQAVSLIKGNGLAANSIPFCSNRSHHTLEALDHEQTQAGAFHLQTTHHHGQTTNLPSGQKFTLNNMARRKVTVVEQKRSRAVGGDDTNAHSGMKGYLGLEKANFSCILNPKEIVIFFCDRQEVSNPHNFLTK